MSVLLVLTLGVVNVVFTAAPAAADPTGTGGQFVPLQSRLVDTRSGTGGVTGRLAADTWTTFTVNGQAGLPSTGVAAIVATVTALNDPGSQSGVLMAGANSGGSTGSAVALLYDVNEIVSNSVVIENGDDGKIRVHSQRSIHLLIDVQGYFTVGNGNPAPGGFVPLAASNITTITAPAAGSTSTVQVTGMAGVPSTATAVYANLVVDNTAAGSANRWLIPFPAGTTPPNPASLNYDKQSKTALGTTIDLNAQGQLSIKFDSAGAPLSVRVDVLGYFDGQPSNAGYTPKVARVYDSQNLAGRAAPDRDHH